MEFSLMRILAHFQLLMILAFVLFGCSPKKQSETPYLSPTIINTPTYRVTRTPSPTLTSQPTKIPTVTPSNIPSSSPTTTPDSALSEVKLIGLAWYDNYDMFLSFQFSKPVDPADYRVTLEDKVYACHIEVGFDDRLYCRGQGAKVLAVATVRVYPITSSTPGFEKEVWVPFFDNNYDSFNQ